MTTFLISACHCGRNKFKLLITTSSLPHIVSLCHCNICRHTTGAMCLNDSPFDGEPLSIDSTEDHHIPGDLSHLTTYHTPKYRRLFCTTCSAHMFMVSDEATKDGKSAWTAMWGVDTTDGIWTISRHIYVGDTLDGGLADHFRTLRGKGLPRFEGSSAESSSRNELPIGWKAVKGRVNPETLPLYCNCGGVKLYLTRAQNVNPDEYWLVPGKEPGEPIQFLAEHCLCTSCRRCSGNQIQTWIYVPNENIFDALTNAPIDLDNLDKRPKALKQYVSSEGVRRESCGTCGAAVFWSREMKDGERPHMSVAAGLIDQDATGGARAEAWIAWDPKLTYGEDALNKEMATALQEGLSEFLESERQKWLMKSNRLYYIR